MTDKNHYFNPMGQLGKDDLKTSIVFENQEDAIKALCQKVFGAEVKYKHEIIKELTKEEEQHE